MKKFSSMLWQRSAGILMHISSLPGDLPIGDFGAQAYRFADFIKSSKMNWWQILPINALSTSPSPYSSFSSFAIEPLFIDIEDLYHRKLIPEESLHIYCSKDQKVDYRKSRDLKDKIYLDAFQTWISEKSHQKMDFLRFCESEDHWLDDFTLFRSLSQRFEMKPWYLWPSGIRRMETKALAHYKNLLSTEILYHKFLQFIAYQQWYCLKQYCHSQKVTILGDLPIYPALNSCDVWTNQNLFMIDPESSQPLMIAGVPPDIFNEEGQKWGNPIYNWDAMANHEMTWWRNRIKHQLKLFDVTRIDHFIGFYRYWAIPHTHESARDGKWYRSKGSEVLHQLKLELNELPIVAEDLGDMIPEVTKLREDFKLPGMKVLQFGFGKDGNHTYRLHCFEKNFIAYTGTHDNNTTRGWFKELKDTHPAAAAEVLSYFRTTEDQLVWDIIQALFASVANVTILPMQDVLNLDESARLNFPGRTDHNWEWRIDRIEFQPYAEILANYVELYDRRGLRQRHQSKKRLPKYQESHS